MSANGSQTSTPETTTATVPSPIPRDLQRAREQAGAAGGEDEEGLEYREVQADKAAAEVDAEEREDEGAPEVLAANFPSCAVAPGIRWLTLCAFPHGTTTTDPR